MKYSGRRDGTLSQTPKLDPKTPRVFRVNVIFGLIFISCATLIFRLGYLQITKGAYIRTHTLSTAVNDLPVIPARGRIYDTNGTLLAYDKPTYSVYLTRLKHINDSPAQIDAMSSLLAGQFHLSETAVRRLLTEQSQYATVRLFQHVDPQQVAFVSEHQGQLPGVSVQLDGQREYPLGDLAGQVLGYVGAITPQNVSYYTSNKEGYLENQQVGVAGLELQYERDLRGKLGYQEQQYSLRTGNSTDVGYVAPVAGDNLQLTLDAHLQAQAQNALLSQISVYEKQNNVQITDASAAVIDVKTGGILAMASYPYLDPNWFVNGAFLQHQTYLSTSGAEANNVIQNPHYPGSTVKPANLITALDHGVITPNFVYDDATPYIYIGNHAQGEDATYGLVGPVKAIAVSDDQFFYQLGLHMGGWLGSSATSGGYPAGGNYARWQSTTFIRGLINLVAGEARFGLGQITGIDLPGEQQGGFYIEDQRYNPSRTVQLNVPQVEQALRSKGQYTNYGSPLDLAFMAFGQMQQVTPIELLQYVATIANNGVKLQPHLLQAVLKPGLVHNIAASEAHPISIFKPVVQAKLHINSTYLKLAQQGMYEAANNPLGTAYQSFANAPYKAAGKTGTATIYMNGKKTHNSVFIGYAPFNNPQIAVVVMVPGAGYGATTAVPIGRTLMDDYFNEHHASFMPKNGWTSDTVPSNWTISPAYLQPDQAK